MTDHQGNGEIGRRAAHKQALRAALVEAANDLFARQGYEATTVRQIADSAGVTERTVYRYFDGKEELLAEDARAWMDSLCTAIRRRPASEAPFEAVHRAMVESAKTSDGANRARVVWQLADRAPPFHSLRRVAPRPLRRLEQAIADALLARSALTDVAPRSRGSSIVTDAPDDGLDADFAAQVLARVAVAVLRSAIVRHRQLLAEPGTRSPGMASLLDEGFELVASLRGVVPGRD